MGLPRGRTIALSPMRRLMCDLMHFSRRVPLVAIERKMQLGALVDARQRLVSRPSWFALFMKAYATVASRHDELRQAYLSFPYARLHQHACNVASLTIVRRSADEDVVFMLKVVQPEQQTLAQIDDLIRQARTEPIEKINDFRRFVRLSRYPHLVRRLMWRLALDVSGNWRARHAGTFGVTGVAALGSASLHTLSPLTTTITYGPLADDGSIVVRLFYDHRIMDGVLPALALQELEQELCGAIIHELGSASRRKRAEAASGPFGSCAARIVQSKAPVDSSSLKE